MTRLLVLFLPICILSFSSCLDDDTIDPALLPTASFETSQHSCLLPYGVTFDNTSTKADHYYWDFGDGDTTDIKHPYHAFKKPGKYLVSLLSANSHGISGDTSTVTITVPYAHQILRGCNVGESVIWEATKLTKDGVTLDHKNFKIEFTGTSSVQGLYFIHPNDLNTLYWPSWNSRQNKGIITIDGDTNITFDAAGAGPSVLNYHVNYQDHLYLKLTWVDANQTSRPAYEMIFKRKKPI